MKSRIFISAISVRAPAVNNLQELEQVIQNKKLDLMPEKILVKPGIDALVYHLQLDKSSPYYPERKDLKVMREDVVAATICAQEIMELAKIPFEYRQHLPLYMSNGVCLDDLLPNVNEISFAYADQSVETSLANKHKRVEKATPPLFVLNALTNGAESFVSQYAGIKGDNTVFGTSSEASIDCLEEGVRAICNGAEMALIGAASGAGLFTALTFDNLRNGVTTQWKLSSGAVFILLESEESILKRQMKPLAELVAIKKGTSVPRLFSIDESPYKTLPPQSEIVLYTGGLGEGDFEQETECVQNKWKKYFSLYSIFGHVGVTSPLLNILAACLKLKEGESCIDCLNRDPYGRESLIHLGQVK